MQLVEVALSVIINTLQRILYCIHDSGCGPCENRQATVELRESRRASSNQHQPHTSNDKPQTTPTTPSPPIHPPFLSSSPAHFAAMPATTAETLSLVTRNVSVAPLVLLSAADHYGRQAKGTRKRVVGVLLGQNDGKNVRVSNSFAGASRFLTCTSFIYRTPKASIPGAITTSNILYSTVRGR